MRNRNLFKNKRQYNMNKKTNLISNYKINKNLIRTNIYKKQIYNNNYKKIIGIIYNLINKIKVKFIQIKIK